MQDVLEPDELDALLASQHQPNYALQVSFSKLGIAALCRAAQQPSCEQVLSELVYACTSSEGQIVSMDQVLPPPEPSESRLLMAQVQRLQMTGPLFAEPQRLCRLPGHL